MKDVDIHILRAKSLKERAYEILKELIFTGKLEPEILYNESRLAAKLGVSRTPVREALLELSGEGMVLFVPGKGVKVQEITEAQVHDVYEIRRLIEGHIIMKITPFMTPSHLSKAKTIINKQKKMAEKKDMLAFIRADRELHFYLSSIRGNRQMDSVLLNLRDQIERMGIKAVENDTRPGRVIEEHRAFLSALERGSETEAYDTLIAHLCNSEKSLISSIKDGEDAVIN